MASLKIKLSDPIMLGSEEITELELKPTGRALRDFTLPMGADGKVDYQPWNCAVVGVKMSGHIITAEKIVDLMSVSDVNEVATAVMGFFGASKAESGKTA